MELLTEHLEEYLRPIAESFFTRLSRKQWSDLLSTTPDESSKEICRGFLNDLVLAFTKFLENEMVSMTSKHEIVATFGNVVPRVFARVMDVEDDATSEHAGKLTALIAEEVREKMHRGDQQTSLRNLDLMVWHCGKVLRDQFLRIKQPEKPTRDGDADTDGFSSTWTEGAAKPGTSGNLQAQILSDRRAFLIEDFLWRLVRRIYKKTDLSCCQRNFQFNRRRLFGKLWAEAEALPGRIGKKNFANLHKEIFKDLRKTISLESAFGKYTDLEQELFEDVLASLFRCHLARKPVLPVEVISASSREAIRRKLMSMPGKELMSMPGKELDKKVPFEDGRRVSFTPESRSTRGTAPSRPGLPGEVSSVPGDSDPELLQKQTRCKTLINKYLTALIPYVFRTTGIPCSQQNYDQLFDRLFQKLWALCLSHDFNLLRDDINKLEVETYKSLHKFCFDPDDVGVAVGEGEEGEEGPSMEVTSQEAPCDAIIAKTFQKHMIGVRPQRSPLGRVLRCKLPKPFQAKN